MKLKKNKKIGVFVVFSLVLVLLCSIVLYREKNVIDNILKTKHYSYLPKEAQNYIKEVYEETGEVIYTEKNKKDNLPYLNPYYINYLTLSEDEKKELDLIPNEFVTDYVYDSKNVAASPSEKYYNLSDEDNNYITPMKNQGNLGICWSYATIENAETFLMVKNGQKYSEVSTEVFSARHLDYAISSFGIEDFINKYGERSLGSGGNFDAATIALSRGLSLVDASWQYNNSNSNEKLELLEVFSDSLPKYELNSTIVVPMLNVKSLNLSNQSDLAKFNNYINEIKNLIKIYGGPYVGTQAPTCSCSAKNYYDNKHHIIDTDSECEKDGAHAMQIVGWDDNYSYKYCKNGKRHEVWSNSCSEENTVSGTGAWILRNSWGDKVEDKYTYLTYDSDGTEYNFITSLESISDKTWDYVYDTQSQNLNIEKISNNGSYEYDIKFNIPFDINAKLSKIKLLNSGQNRQYKIYISVSGSDSDYRQIKSFSVDNAGITTIDFESENIIINKKSKVKIESNSSLTTRFISLFTSETTENVSIYTKDKYYEESDGILENGLYKIHLYSDVYNAVPNSQIDYKIYNQEGEEITGNVVIKNNIVSMNMLNPIIYLPSINSNSYFTVKTFYNNNELGTSKLFAESPKPAKGKGTVEDPYVIMSPEDLYLINYNLSSHFVLGTDIDLTYDTQNENGLYYNSGNGWTAIGYDKREAFTGSINGKYNGKIHKIKGLKTNSIGLIFYVEPDENDVSIKNLIFEDAIINNSNMLAYTIVGTKNHKVSIENIAAINSTFTNSNMLAYIMKSYGKDSISINSIFSNSTFIQNDGVMSILAWGTDIYEDYTKEASINISNIEILGKINNKSSSFTALLRFPKGKTKIENVIFNNYSATKPYLFARLSSSVSGNKPILNNIYYLNDININLFNPSDYVSDNFTNLSISDLRNSNQYENWKDFDKYWVINNEKDIGRIPILKFVPFEYTSVNEINLKEGETVNIYDYIYPQIEASKNIIFEYDDKTQFDMYIDDDGTIEGFSAGMHNVHIKSLYDGYENDIKVNIYNESKSIIKYYSNTTSNDLVQQIVDKSEKFNLNKISFEKEGYIFKEWNTKEDGSGTSYLDEQELTLNDDLTLFAQWTPIKFTIQFNSNDGKNDMYSQTMTYDVRESLSEIKFINDDPIYFFKEWNTKEDGSGISYQNEEFVLNITSKNEEIINLYAIWEKSLSIITFRANGGIGSMDNIIVDKGTMINLPQNEFTKEGYIFKEWNTKEDGSGISYLDEQEVIITDDLNLYAIWKENAYKISFDANGGTGMMDDIVVIVDDYMDTSVPYSNFTKEGYKMTSWNTKPDGSGEEYRAGGIITPTSDIILYAQWTAKSYSVIYYYYFKDNQESIKRVVFTYDTESELREAYKGEEGYKFAYWGTKADGTGINYLANQKVKNLTTGTDINLYTIYEPITYKISFNSNDENNETLEQSFTYDITDNLKSNLFIRDGYRFIGWNTESDGTGMTYQNEQSVKNLTTEDNSVITLYAIWEKSFSYVIDNYIVDEDNKYIDLIVPYTTVDEFKNNIVLNDGYTVDIEYKSVNGENLIYTGGKTRIYKDDELYAEYTNIIRGDVNGNAVIDIIDYIRIMKHIMEEIVLDGEYFKAADFTQENGVDIIDYIRIMKMIMEEN